MTTPSRALRLPVFVAAALRRPGTVGAVAPSSPSLCRVLAEIVPSAGAPTVVELGAGTGAVSTAIQKRMPEDGRHLAVEIDAELASHLRESHPGMQVLHGDAADLRTLITEAGAETVNAVVSGLPWSLFGEPLQKQILREVCRTMSKDAVFSTFAYRHATGLAGARRFRALLDEHFDEVVVSRTVWCNLPPALVYVCRNH